MSLVPGRIHGVHVKPSTPGERGLPKRPVPSARVTTKGLEGDFNEYRTRKLGGDPDSAVLVVPLETLRGLEAEGWPVKPGHLGENLTTEGVPYEAFAPGSRWRVGSVEIQVSRPCDPCTNLYLLPYVGDAKGPAFVKTMMGRRGWYARVLREGVVRVGDAVARMA